MLDSQPRRRALYTRRRDTLLSDTMALSIRLRKTIMNAVRLGSSHMYRCKVDVKIDPRLRGPRSASALRQSSRGLVKPGPCDLHPIYSICRAGVQCRSAREMQIILARTSVLASANKPPPGTTTCAGRPSFARRGGSGGGVGAPSPSTPPSSSPLSYYLLTYWPRTHDDRTAGFSPDHLILLTYPPAPCHSPPSSSPSLEAEEKRRVATRSAHLLTARFLK